MENEIYISDITKKVLEKAIVNELYKNDVIELNVCSNIIKKIDMEIEKMKNINGKNAEKEQMTIKIPIQ